MNTSDQNKNILHHETLQSLCALQYYMSTLSTQGEEEKQRNYLLSFKLMKKIIDTLINTLDDKVIEEYPLDLILIHKNIENINQKLNYIIK